MAAHLTNRSRPAERGSTAWQAVDTYATRVMCGMVASLSIALAVVHVPLESGSRTVGWYVVNHVERERIEVQDVREEIRQESGVPITLFDQRSADMDLDEGEATKEEEQPEEQLAERTRPKRISGLRTLDIAAKMPEIVGGLGAFYIHIDYPQEAIEKGIQGRLVLSFVVDTLGRTENIEVVESLYPACDSAAIAALRETRFVPGRQDGDIVPVRMRMPVRFRLVSTNRERERVEEQNQVAQQN